jgi:Uma2 family endonuclease
LAVERFTLMNELSQVDHRTATKHHATMNPVLAPVLLSSEFPELLRELNSAWEAEQQRRHKFREELTPNMKAEFINGQVFEQSPSMAREVFATMHLMTLIDTWVVEHQLGLVTVEKALICLSRNDYEPDIAFFKGLSAATVSPTMMEFPAPDFVVEVLSPSTEQIDRGVKMRDYAKHGVREYWLVDCKAQAVERYLLQQDQRSFEHAGTHDSGEVTSVVIEGFSIPVAAIFEEAAQHDALRRMFRE